jgi:curved DNA-binding protein
MAPRDRDFYRTLGVARDASPDEIQRAYRRLARQYHPDVNKDPSAEERFKEISEAYDVLSNPDTRRRYDRFGERFRQVPEGAEAAGGPFRSGARPGGPGGGGVRVDPDVEFVDAQGVDINDLFESLFRERAAGRGGGRGGFGGFGPMPGADTEAELPLTVEEAYAGGQRHITLSTPSGTREYDVTIPPGVTNGQRIRLAGQGTAGSGGAPSGDLYLVVRLLPHPRYRVDGRDISTDLPVAPWEAALGARVPVETPGGSVQVNVPPGSSCGRRLRLRGQGMPNRNGQPGDFYAEVKIMVPRTLTQDERDLFEQLAKTSRFNPRANPGRRR